MVKPEERRKNILKLLANEKRKMTSAEICSYFGISRRTLINDIQLLNNPVTIITSSPEGYSLNPSEIPEIDGVLNEDTEENTSVDLLRRLLISKQENNVYEIASSFGVSQVTLQKMVDEVNKKIQPYDLRINKIKNFLQIEGEEKNKRLCLARILHSETDGFLADIDNLHIYFPDFNVSQMSEMIIGVVKKHHYHVSEYYYMNFIINVLVILSRSDYSYGYCVDDASDCDNSEPEMCIAKEITKQCEKLNNISYENFDDVSIHVKNILYGFITKAENTIPSSKIHYLPKEFVSKIRSILHDVFSYYNLDINYELFLGVFCFHVWEMLKRCERSLPFAPSSVSVKQTDPYVYEISVRIAHEISTQFNVVIPDSEINLIAVHIGYAIEQDYPVDETIHYIIISDNYHGIADKIKKEIELKYDKRAQFQGLYNSLNDVPFRLAISSMIISTKPPVMTPFNITTVSPFFKYQDQKAISEAIEKMIDKQKKNEFAKLFFAYSNSDSFVNASYPMDYLEAIHILAGKAVSDNIVDNDFESHVLERERLSSTAFFNKFAVPHSNMLVAKATRLYIMINRYGISWKSQTVKVVLLIVIDHTASKEFRKLYNIIIETLSNDETIMKNIDKIKSLDDFVALIREAQNNV